MSTPVWGVDQLDPESPQLYREQPKAVETVVKSFDTVTVSTPPGLYRAWINPVKTTRSPADQARTKQVVTPSIRNPALEQTFSKTKEWKPGKIVHLYEKSKDFDTILNPLSLKDFNRFIYQRNPKSP